MQRSSTSIHAQDYVDGLGVLQMLMDTNALLKKRYDIPGAPFTNMG